MSCSISVPLEGRHSLLYVSTIILQYKCAYLFSLVDQYCLNISRSRCVLPCDITTSVRIFVSSRLELWVRGKMWGFLCTHSECKGKTFARMSPVADISTVSLTITFYAVYRKSTIHQVFRSPRARVFHYVITCTWISAFFSTHW